MKINKTSLIFIAALLTSCRGLGNIIILNQVKLSNVLTDPLRDNSLIRDFQVDLIDHIFQGADNSVAVAPTEVLMNYMSVLFGTTSNEALISDLGFVDEVEMLDTYKKMQSYLRFDNDKEGYLKTTSFYQFVDTSFDDVLLEEIYNKSDISVIQSTLKNGHNDAKKFIKHQIGIDNNINAYQDIGVYSYNATNLTDNFNMLRKQKQKKVTIDYKESVDNVYSVEGIEEKGFYQYYYNSEKKFHVVNYLINKTTLMLIVPEIGADISAIQIKDLDASLLRYRGVNLSIPKFNVAEISHNITNFMESKFGDIQPFSKFTDIAYFASFTNSIFEFNEKGVGGKSYTQSIGAGSAQPPEEVVELVIDRPFYAISYFNNNPLFAAKIVGVK